LTIKLAEEAQRFGKPEPIKLGHQLVKVNRVAGKYDLQFASAPAATGVDLLVFACPFTMLSTVSEAEGKKRLNEMGPVLARRHLPRFARMHKDAPDFQPGFEHVIDLSDLKLPSDPEHRRPSKADTIDRVSYGRNMKVMAGTSTVPDGKGGQTAIWRSLGGFGGYTFSDRDFQMGWDSGECQDLAALPTARLIPTSRNGQPIRKSNGLQSWHVLPTAAVRNPSQVVQGRMFSWFLGGDDIAEGILKDPSLKGFVSHTRDNQLPNDPNLLVRFAKGLHGVTTPNQGIHRHVSAVVRDTDGVYRGFENAYNAQSRAMGVPASTSMIWTNDPFTRGSYLAYGPGQWTSMSGLEGAPLTYAGTDAPASRASEWTVFFAGEHCSSEFQGFMNGGAQTGRLAAQRILFKLVGEVAARAFSPSELANLAPERRQFFFSGLDRIFG
ncbi:MAG TPA: FAD-dependent oxidoreductase, partial [Bdellovibrionota bacterium]|nr:FAD-dependent oxidoreductase [Bdellovibrionota bacterium]